jgi:hypothetical protein
MQKLIEFCFNPLSIIERESVSNVFFVFNDMYWVFSNSKGFFFTFAFLNYSSTVAEFKILCRIWTKNLKIRKSIVSGYWEVEIQYHTNILLRMFVTMLVTLGIIILNKHAVYISVVGDCIGTRLAWVWTHSCCETVIFCTLLRRGNP